MSPFIPKEAGEEVKKTIDSGWINTGEKERLFKEQLKKKFRWIHCILTNSCTSALRLVLAHIGVNYGDEVISTPWTMIATNTAILEQGAKPVFADIKYDTLNIDPNDIERKITDKTKAIMMVHYAGYPCNLTEIYKIAIENNLHVIEDAAQALGSKYRGRYIGRLGEYCCFSFQTVKIINTGDGGAITCQYKEDADRLLAKSWFGINKSERKRTVLGIFPDDITELGYKYNMNDITATLGLVSLKYFDDILKRRQDIGKIYFEELSNLKKITLLDYNFNQKETNFWMFPMHVKNRNKFAEYMRDNNIEVTIHNHRNDKWSIFGGIQKDLLITEKVEKDIIHIPIHQDLSNNEIEYIIKTIKKWDKI
jgi:perosamine synthetase